MFHGDARDGVEKELIFLAHRECLATEVVRVLRGAGGEPLDAHDECLFLDPAVAIFFAHRYEVRLSSERIDSECLALVKKQFDLGVRRAATDFVPERQHALRRVTFRECRRHYSPPFSSRSKYSGLIPSAAASRATVRVWQFRARQRRETSEGDVPISRARSPSLMASSTRRRRMRLPTFIDVLSPALRGAVKEGASGGLSPPAPGVGRAAHTARPDDFARVTHRLFIAPFIFLFSLRCPFPVLFGENFPAPPLTTAPGP